MGVSGVRRPQIRRSKVLWCATLFFFDINPGDWLLRLRLSSRIWHRCYFALGRVSRLHKGAGMKDVLDHGKINRKKKMLYLWKWGHSQDHRARIYSFSFCYSSIFVLLPKYVDNRETRFLNPMMGAGK